MLRQLRRSCARLGRGGAVMLEFAIVAPGLFFIIFMMVELGWQLTVDLALNLGAISGSRYGVTGVGYTAGSRDASILGAVLGASGGILQSSRLTLADTSYTSAASYAASGAATSGPGGSGQFVVYTLTYQQPFLTGLPGMVLGRSSLTHTAVVLVQNEPF
jgi:Flp pilus assembly protein TadG